MKTDVFQSCGHCWVFQIFWPIECSTLTTLSFRIWNSSGGISFPPLDLFVVILPKVHLTSHSKMSGSRWVITPLWLSGSLISFLYSSSLYSCHLSLISYYSIRSISCLSFIVPIFEWNVPLLSLIFLKRSNFIVFLYSLHYSLKILSYLSLLFFGTLYSYWCTFACLLCLSLSFFIQLFARPPQKIILPFCISFSWGWFWSPPTLQWHKPLSIVLQALYQIYSLNLFLFSHYGIHISQWRDYDNVFWHTLVDSLLKILQFN